MGRVEDLGVWREAVALLAEVHPLVKRLPADEREHLGERLFRAAVAVPARIADGHDSGDRAFFLDRLRHASEALAELGTLIVLAEQLGHVTPAELAALERARETVAAPLRGLADRVRRDLAGPSGGVRAAP